ncbi:MAG TPA: hypothetical protein VIM86_12165 [Thermodesulfobacteriota bacterium]
MSSLSPTLTRRAWTRLATAHEEPPAGASSRYAWLHVIVPVPLPEDSRTVRPVLSTSLATDRSRVIDVAALVAAAAGAVALLSVVCR